MIASAPVKLGMIGCGLISHAHGKAAAKSAHPVRFVTCASRRADVAASWARTYGCDTSYTDYREMLRNETLDGIVITTWPTGHRRQIEDALEAGVRFILCEKALVTSDADALAVWEAARQRGATVIEGFMYRHHEMMLKADEIVSQGGLGMVDSIEASFHMFDPEQGNPVDDTRTWRQRRDAGGGVLHDFLCYAVNAANHFAGALPVRVFASGSDSAKFDVTDRLYALIDYANGCVATVASSRKACLRQALTIVGSDGVLEVPVAWTVPRDATLSVTTSPSFLGHERTEYRFPAPEPSDAPLIDLPVFTRQLENFVQVIRGADEPVVPLTASVVDAVVRSAIERSYRSQVPDNVRFPDQFPIEMRSPWNG